MIIKKGFELWTIVRVVPPPPTPLVLGRMDVSGSPLPCGVAIFTSRAKAELMIGQTLMAGIQVPMSFTPIKLGVSPSEVHPAKYLGLVTTSFMQLAIGLGIEMHKAGALLALSFGVFIDPMDPGAVLKSPTQPNLHKFLAAYFPKEIAGLETVGLKFYKHNGYQVLIECLSGTWLVAAKRGEFDNVEGFRENKAKLGEAFYGTFKTAEQSVEEAELWINGTRELEQMLGNGKS